MSPIDINNTWYTNTSTIYILFKANGSFALTTDRIGQ